MSRRADARLTLRPRNLTAPKASSISRRAHRLRQCAFIANTGKTPSGVFLALPETITSVQFPLRERISDTISGQLKRVCSLTGSRDLPAISLLVLRLGVQSKFLQVLFPLPMALSAVIAAARAIRAALRAPLALSVRVCIVRALLPISLK